MVNVGLGGSLLCALSVNRTEEDCCFYHNIPGHLFDNVLTAKTIESKSKFVAAAFRESSFDFACFWAFQEDDTALFDRY